MRAGIIVGTLVAFVAILFFIFTGYQSAFEADQACHYAKWENHKDNPKFDCDHDLETKQWILYQSGENHTAAKVLQRFRY